MDDKNIVFRYASEGDVPLILKFIKELADYEKMLDEVVATEELLRSGSLKRKRLKSSSGMWRESSRLCVVLPQFLHLFGRAGIILKTFTSCLNTGKRIWKGILRRTCTDRNGQRL
jgi:hypothetical protein